MPPQKVKIDSVRRRAHAAQAWKTDFVLCCLGHRHGKVDPSNMSDEYEYLASEWSGHIDVPIVLLGKNTLKGLDAGDKLAKRSVICILVFSRPRPDSSHLLRLKFQARLRWSKCVLN
jgi:hypothetical protein